VVVYIDTSALVKLLVPERESRALQQWLVADGSSLVSSALTRVELMRAVRRSGRSSPEQVSALLRTVSLLGLSDLVLDRAGRLDPVELRSLDAIHVATALDLGSEIDTLLTYDARLISFCSGFGLVVASPS
jgi:predicted nucleic acid-binding protein